MKKLWWNCLSAHLTLHRMVGFKIPIAFKTQKSLSVSNEPNLKIQIAIKPKFAVSSPSPETVSPSPETVSPSPETVSPSPETVSPAPIVFNGQLHDYQKQFLEWAMPLECGINGFDMGLGKTPTTIALICQKGYNQTLIVLPLALLDQWRTELLKFTNLKPSEIVTYHGSSRASLRFEGCRIILTTYDVVRMDMRNEQSLLFQFHDQFDCLVLDEAHKIRNEKTAIYDTCSAIGDNVSAKWLLSGTAIQNKINDFITLLKFMGLPDYADTQLLKKYRDKYYYRLTKAECDLKLPNKYLHEHFLDFDDHHQMIYDVALDELQDAWNDHVGGAQIHFSTVLSKILRLRQCCNHPNSAISQDVYSREGGYDYPENSAKFIATMKLIKATPASEKVIVFSQWSHSLNLIAKDLDKQGLTYKHYHSLGNKSINERNQIIEKFKSSSTKVLLATTASAGVGLNLVCANHIILLDPWWNESAEAQAIDRAYRLGQTKDVHVHRLYMNESLEKWLISLKEEKTKVNLTFHSSDDIHQVDHGKLKEVLKKYLH
jgi:SNF2 family DNA or RNA helicase